MASSNMNKTGKPALFVFLMGALLFNLSSLPGAETEVVAQSTDLLSTQFLNCDIEHQVRVNGVAECGDLEKNKIKGRVTVEKVSRGMKENEQGPANPDAPVEYRVTSEVECDICETGVRPVSRTVLSLREVAKTAENLFNEQAKVAAVEKNKEKERLKRIELCLEDEEGNEITRQNKILACRIEKLNALDGEEADEYYADHVKDEIQGLLQSNSPNDRRLGMGVLEKMGKEMSINCASRPGLQQDGRNPLLSQSNLNPIMGSMTSSRYSRRSSEDSRSFIKESACDMWAFGTYNNNVEYLQLVAAQPGANKAAVKHALQSLKTGWGVYFQQRGLQLQTDPLGMFGLGDQLYGDFSENNDALTKGLQAIVDKHKDILQPAVQDPNAAANAAAAGRLARGGIPAAPGVANGTVAGVNPWPSPLMQPAPNPGKFTGAPKMGTPVGSVPR